MFKEHLEIFTTDGQYKLEFLNWSKLKSKGHVFLDNESNNDSRLVIVH